MTQFDRVFVRNAEGVIKKVEAEKTRIRMNKDKAALAAAKTLVPFVKQALPRNSRASRPGFLRSHVHAYQDISGEGLAKVKLTGSLAHLVYGDTKEHAITPRSGEHLATWGRMRRISKAGKVAFFLGADQGGEGARAILVGTHPYARAIHPAHRGAPSPLPAVQAEHAGEARAAAMEVIRRG